MSQVNRMVNRDWPPHLSSSSLSTSSPFPGSLTHIIAISHTFAHCCHHFSLISYTSSVNIHHVIALSHTFWSILAKRRFNYLHSCILSLHLYIDFFQTLSPSFAHFCHFSHIVPPCNCWTSSSKGVLRCGRQNVLMGVRVSDYGVMAIRLRSIAGWGVVPRMAPPPSQGGST